MSQGVAEGGAPMDIVVITRPEAGLRVGRTGVSSGVRDVDVRPFAAALAPDSVTCRPAFDRSEERLHALARRRAATRRRGTAGAPSGTAGTSPRSTGQVREGLFVQAGERLGDEFVLAAREVPVQGHLSHAGLKATMASTLVAPTPSW